MSLISRLKEELKDEWKDFQREFRNKYREPVMRELAEALLGKLAAWVPAKYRDRILSALGRFVYSLIFEQEEDSGDNARPQAS